LARGQGEAEDRRRVRIHPVDTGLLDRLRQPRQDAVHLVAHFLRRDVGVFLQREKHDDLRDALGRDRAEIVDPADGVDRLLDLVGDFRFNLLRRGAGLDRRHRDRREVDLGKAVDAKLRERKNADDGQRQNQDAGEDGTFDADCCKPLHRSPSS
jgi:hypothetical protein